MKQKLKNIFSVCMLAILMMISFGCYFVVAQPMNKLKGTYHMTRYTVTDGGNDSVTDYIEDRGYDVYLIITGTGTGYYVHSDPNTPAYYREVILSYEYDTEDASKVSRITYKFSVSDSGYSLGVSGKNLNFSKPPLKFSDKIYTDGRSMSMEKVSDAIDLSYVQSQLGEIVPFENP
ncbi:MAG: hypothetical protein J6D30_03570 [Clostridia bacterium]|nr:hypothetical protein [Clostridia bacterium]